MPTVSVVIPTYNSAGYVAAAIESALAQSFNDLEVLVVDDGSTDNTREVLAAYETDGAASVRSIYQENAGVAVARNTGIAQSRGHYVALLDADDRWLPTKLERQLEVLAATPQAGACNTAHIAVDDDLKPLEIHRYERVESTLEGLLLRGNVVGTPSSVIVERRWFEQAGGFDPQLSHSADWEMWMRLAQHTDFVYLDEPLLQYRQHATNMSRDLSLFENDTLAALRKGFNHPATPQRMRARSRAGIGRQWRVIAGYYFQNRRYKDFARCTAQALRHDPSQFAYLLSFPRRLVQKMAARRATARIS